MKKGLIFLCGAMLSLAAIAQEKTYSMYDAVIGGYTNLAPKRLSQLQWIPETQSFAEVKKEEGKSWVEIQVLDDTKNGMKRTISLEEIQEALQKVYPGDSLKSMPGIRFMDEIHLRFYHNEKMLLYNHEKQNIELLTEYKPSTDGHAEFNGDYRSLAYVKDDNIIIRKNGEEIAITSDGGKGIVYGQSVHRNEFGITKGLFWSPDGSKLAFYRMDESMVTEYPVYNLKSTPATADMIRYPVAGGKSHHVTVGVYDFKNGKTTYLNTGEPAEQYLTNVTWGPDNNHIYIAVVNRAQNHMWLKSFHAGNGEQVKILFEESHDKYVEPEHGPLFLNTKPDQFVWQSERNGYNHLYLYNTDGKLIKQLTSGEYVVTDVLGIDPKDDCILFTATSENGLSQKNYRLLLKNGKMNVINDQPGIHTAMLSSDYKYILDVYHNLQTPYRVEVRKTDGKLYSKLFEAENPLSNYAMGEMEIGQINSKDGQASLNYRIIKPVGFDPTKKYPVIVYLYNGPHVQLVNNGWLGGANLWYHLLAQKGFIVFTIDGRGSANRGIDFENAVFRQMGTLEMEDQLAGIELLKTKDWVDSNRMGVHGWSYGGFMTTSLMTRKAGTFKVGVAGGPVIDWRLYEVMYTERYMDTPEENPDGYAANNLLNHIDKLEDKLLIIHGAEDDVVLWQHSLLLLEEAIKKGIQLDYFVYPHHKHNVRGKDRVHLMQKVTDYLIEGLSD